MSSSFHAQHMTDGAVVGGSFPLGSHADSGCRTDLQHGLDFNGLVMDL